MAKKASRPGARLIVFGLVIVAMYGLVAAVGDWSPKLGLDLQGGTRITLVASTATGEPITPEKLKEAAGIIDSRVNGSGVAESEVSTQGKDTIIVEIPGKNRSDLVDTVKQTAQLRFRLVAAAADGRPVEPSASPSATPSASPSASPSTTSTAKPGVKPSNEQSAKPKASPKGRAVSGGLVALDDQPSAKATKTPKATPSADPTEPTEPDAGGASVDDPMAWIENPGTEWLTRFQEFSCPADGSPAPVKDVPDEPLLACDSDGVKYLLSAAMIEGTELKNASAQLPDVSWVVNLTFNKSASKTFGEVTSAFAGTNKQFAIVLDGQVLSAPTVISPILDGSAQISGSFTQASATSLANSLKYGALPLRFAVPVVSEEGPTLAADQLSAGLWAGAIGLFLVMLYCLLYYRGLGLVVVASLFVVGVVTYAVVLLMSTAAGFTLSLPGIAGLIVAVGITADSFIVYFERIRDEMREGKSMRVAVEAGWVRAWRTCVAADAVSLTAAVVLYIFAIGVVKGFAFALGISTVIDLVVFFLFTKPMVTWLATFKFFNTGHKLSGLSPEHIGIERIGSARPAGGTA